MVGAGNRTQDSAVTRPMSSALVNRMFHIVLTANSRLWLERAARNGIHRYVYDYICLRPDQLWGQPLKTDEPFSTPRSWYMLSDAISGYGDGISEAELTVLANGCLTAAHATQFVAYLRQVRSQYSLTRLMNGGEGWPDRPEDRDVLYFLAQSFRSQLQKELPPKRENLSGSAKKLAARAKVLFADLADISLEIARVAVTPEEGDMLANWFLIEAARDIPGLAGRKWGKS